MMSSIYMGVQYYQRMNIWFTINFNSDVGPKLY